jgi:hypothetical protein
MAKYFDKDLPIHHNEEQELLKTIEMTFYDRYAHFDIHIGIGDYGYIPLKIGDSYSVYAHRMYDFHIDRYKVEGPASIHEYALNDHVLVLAKTPDGIEGIIFFNNTEEYTNEVKYISIIDKGFSLVTNLEIGIYTNLNNRKNLWH